MNYEIFSLRTKKDLDLFTMLPFELYDEKSPWVAPLIGDYKKYIEGINNSLKKVGPSEKILVLKDGQVLGRLLVGINQDLNSYHGLKEAYISQFECHRDLEAARALLDYAKAWAKERGMDKLKGPLSLPGGDDNRGFLIDNYEAPVYIMNTYNKDYYNDFFLDYGFKKYADCYAFESDLKEENLERYKHIVPLLMKRFNYRLDRINLKDKEKLRKDAQDIKKIIEEAMPRDWLDFMPLTDKEIDDITKELVPFADADFIFIARSNEDDEPIGFNISLPDYNQVLKKMRGRLLPTGFISFLLNRKKIDRARMFVLFVTPSYRKKGVTGAIYLYSQLNALKKGYKQVEGSTIWDYNKEMLADIQRYGAKKTKTYRIYEMNI